MTHNERPTIRGTDGRRTRLLRRRRRWDIVAVIAIGGALGASVRHTISDALPQVARAFRSAHSWLTCPAVC
jgi:hypothetical protein